jgi:hypothetical protein
MPVKNSGQRFSAIGPGTGSETLLQQLMAKASHKESFSPATVEASKRAISLEKKPSVMTWRLLYWRLGSALLFCGDPLLKHF